MWQTSQTSQTLYIKNNGTNPLKAQCFILEGTLVSSQAEITLCQGETNSPSSFKQDLVRTIHFFSPAPPYSSNMDGWGQIARTFTDGHEGMAW